MSLYIWMTYSYLVPQNLTTYSYLIKCQTAWRKLVLEPGKRNIRFCAICYIDTQAIKLMQQAYICFLTRSKPYTRSSFPYKRTGIKSLLGLAHLLHSISHKNVYCAVPFILTTTERCKMAMDGQQMSIAYFQLPKNCSHHLTSPKLKLVLAYDASAYGIGAVLAHKYPDSSEKPTGYVSCSLSKAEKNYSQIKKEHLACVVGVNKFHSYLLGHSCELITDHKPVTTLFH